MARVLRSGRLARRLVSPAGGIIVGAIFTLLLLSAIAPPNGAGSPSRAPVPSGAERADAQAVAPSVGPGATPGGNLGSLRVVLHNPMATATGPYQQRLSVDSADFSGLINSNWTNGVAFYTANSTPIYGWIEGNASNQSANTTLYLKLASIPADAWTNVSIYFWPKSSFNLSSDGYMGEAPQLSSTYGEFDNGALVFNFYDDFAGKSLSSHWAVDGNWSYTVDNGFYYDTVPGDGDAIISTTNYAYPAVVDFYSDLFQTNPASAYTGGGLGSGGDKVSDNSSAIGWASQGNENGPVPGTASGGEVTGGYSVTSTQEFGVFTSEAISTSDTAFYFDYGDYQTFSQYVPTGPLPVELADTGAPAGSLTNAQSVYWIRERSYVATMPTYTIAQQALMNPATFAETGLPSASVWWVNISGIGLESSTSTTISVELANGEYDFSAATGSAGYTAPNGSFDMNGAPLSVPVDFTKSAPAKYAVTFTETGLPAGTEWWANVTGEPPQSGTTPSVTIDLGNGSYDYAVGVGLSRFSAPGGSFTVDGKALTEPIAFTERFTVTFTETGLPTETRWWANVSGEPAQTATTPAIDEGLTNGSYSYSVGVSPTNYSAPGGEFEVAGTVVAVSVAFTHAPVLRASFTYVEAAPVETCLDGILVVGSMNVSFAATTENGTAPLGFSWEFGDASPDGVGRNVTHTYEYALFAPYTVNLTVTDARGNRTDYVGMVAAPTLPTTCPTSSASKAALLEYAIIGVVVAAGVIGVVLALVLSARRRPPPSASYAPPPVAPPDAPSEPPISPEP